MMRAFTKVLLGGLLLAVQVSAGDALLSNLPGTGSGTGSNLGLNPDGADRTKAVGLTMGGTAMPFVDLVALISNTDPGSELSGGIFSDVGGNPGVELAPFAPVAVGPNTPVGEVSITTAAPFTLEANTSYWFVLDGPTTTQSLLWETLTPNTAPVASAAATFDGYRFSSNGGTTWGASGLFNGVQINVPEPAAALLLGLGVVMLRRR